MDNQPTDQPTEPAKPAKRAKRPADGRRPRGAVTRAQLADRLKVHPMTVTKWEQSGLPVEVRGRKGKPSYYLEAKARAWLLAREEAAKGSGLVDVARERARKEHAQALEAEQRIAIRAREYLPVVEVERAWAFEVQAVRTAILATYNAEADRVYRRAMTDGPAGVADELKALAYQILRELAGARELPPEKGVA